jgi:anti-sigma regulatory factor (Ser/Thr protein kinase)
VTPTLQRTNQTVLGEHTRDLARVRAWTRGELERLQITEPQLSQIVLAASELAANALEHAAPPCWIEIGTTRTHVLVAVHDHAPQAPLPARRDPHSHRGRGLLIVARVATSWGTQTGLASKCVWFTHDLTTTETTATAHTTMPAAPSAATRAATPAATTEQETRL